MRAPMMRRLALQHPRLLPCGEGRREVTQSRLDTLWSFIQSNSSSATAYQRLQVLSLQKPTWCQLRCKTASFARCKKRWRRGGGSTRLSRSWSATRQRTSSYLWLAQQCGMVARAGGTNAGPLCRAKSREGCARRLIAHAIDGQRRKVATVQPSPVLELLCDGVLPGMCIQYMSEPLPVRGPELVKDVSEPGSSTEGSVWRCCAPPLYIERQHRMLLLVTVTTLPPKCPRLVSDSQPSLC